MTARTPWGYADTTPSRYGPGIAFYSTPSHGGFFVAPTEREKIPQRYRDFAARWSKGWGDGWYEEDVAALAVVVTFPDRFPHITSGQLDGFREMLDHYTAEEASR